MPRLRNILIILGLLLPAWAFAQFTPDPVQYIVTPEVPGPGDTVTIEVQGVGTFLGDATITWQKDGKVVQSGAGSRSYSFVAGGLGSMTRIHIDIKSATNGSFSKDFIFRPSVISLVWEADTSAPPLYLGKPLYSAGSPLKVVAFPNVVINGSRVAAQSLSYQWSRGGDYVADASGLGRSAYSFAGDQLQKEEDITVDVYFGQTLVGRGGIAIPAADPQVVLYERDALRGALYDLALPPAFNLNAKEITVLAQPYSFARSSLTDGSLEYAWTLNDNDIAGPDSARGLLTLRQTGAGVGSAELQVSLQNNSTDQLVQSAQAAVSILLGQASSGSLFGI
jgi:hypothetical protein